MGLFAEYDVATMIEARRMGVIFENSLRARNPLRKLGKLKLSNRMG